MAEENSLVLSGTVAVDNDYYNQAINIEPSTWRDYETAKESFLHDIKYTKLFFFVGMEENLMCFNCQRPLSVGPFFYEKDHPNNKACGRCFRDPASPVHTREMLQDHLYEKLIPHFQFQCSCELVFSGSKVADHEINCFTQPSSEQSDDGQKRNTFNMFVVHSDVASDVNKLCETLSCDLCNEPLSVFPVVSDSKRFICGRCEKPNSGEWIEQMIYFDTARYVEFPCHHANCNNMARVDEVVKHHKNCRWAAMLCPLDCGLLYPLAEMSIHIRRMHLHESVDRIEAQQRSFLFQIEAEPYVVSVKAVDVERQLYACAVLGLDEKEYDHLLMETVDKDSGSVSHRSTVQVARLEQQPFQSTTVQIEKNAYLRLATLADVFAGLTLDEESRQRFECPVCYSFMTREIFKCENGHPICDQCKARIDQSCPMCRGVLPAYGRHVRLEIEAAAFKFPCAMQESNNCNVTLMPAFLPKHEARCKWREAFRSEDCVSGKCISQLDIVFDQHDDYFNHCVQEHLDSVMYTGSKEIFKWSTEADAPPPSPSVSLLFFDGEVFLVIFHYSKEDGVFLRISHRISTRWETPHYKSYKLTVDFKNIMLTTSVDLGTVSVLALPWKMRLDNERIEKIVSVGPTFSWLEYQVKLEIEKKAV